MDKVENLKSPTTLRELREQKNLSQEYVAHSIGLTRNAYQRYEQGLAEPKLLNFLAIARFYQVPLKQLVVLMGYDVTGIPDDELTQ